ncbi:MAG: copper resistance protein NlpE [Flavobacterium sp. JAD_PAG50586_2]|nr:MAG: copper resistance protein NlpE [Flavobacterium sp. JAD_PAG50586_2]
MKINILFVLMILTLVSCQKQSAHDKKSTSNYIPRNSEDYIGTYKGILPCADCKGLETEIAINENTTFSIKTKYQGKGDKIFVKKGHFTWNKKGDVIILTDVNEPNQYLVGKNRIIQLDIYGKKSPEVWLTNTSYQNSQPILLILKPPIPMIRLLWI